jgi:Protein of unknown function (DUF1488)
VQVGISRFVKILCLPSRTDDANFSKAAPARSGLGCKRRCTYACSEQGLENAMPLTRASEQPVLKRDEIRFLMSNGANEVICNISHRALLAFGVTVGMTDTGDIFLAYRDEIEHAASAKYDRTAHEQYEILDIDENDL